MKSLNYTTAPALSPYIKDEMWTLDRDWQVEIDEQPVTIPRGTMTDGASIPRFLWRVCGHPMSTERIASAIVHDAIYDGTIRGFSRKDADRIYRDSLIQRGFPRWKARLEYFVLRIVGVFHWTADDDELLDG